MLSDPNTSLDHSLLTSPSGQTQANPASSAPHLIFIDARVNGFSELTANLADAEVFSIQTDRDGIAQISEIIQQHTNIASIHIISHGAAGEVQIGNQTWNQDSLTGQNSELRSWSEHLSSEADILFYGCNVGAEADGLAFVQSVSQATGADVAASNDVTGNAAFGGDWDLEIATGAIESTDILSPERLAQYQGTLPIYNGNNYILTASAKTWEQAQAEARSLGGNLVTVNNAAEETWLRQTFGTSEWLWTGLTDRRIEGTFEWASGEISTYRNWAPGEPNNAGGLEDYGHINFGSGWNDLPATSVIRGIIEIPTTQSFTYNGNTYRLTGSAKNWEEAQAEARSLGGNLVTINNAAEETWLRQTFGTSEWLWTGLTDRRVEGTFEWASGEVSTYRNWAPGEPNDAGGAEDYGHINFGSGWNDLPATSMIRGIVEIPTTPSFTYNGSAYRLTSTTLTWEQAQAQAQSLGGNLVTINNTAEETWLRQTFGSEGLWIGLNDRDVEGQFRWANGEAVSYTNWAPGEPNNAGGNQDYGWMNFTSTGQWDDNFPTATLRGIIEIPTTPTLTYNGSTYRLTGSAKTWEEAQAEARTVGGNLVTINDAAEETWLRQTFGSEGLWIGLNDRRLEGIFEWVSGDTATYRNWAPGEPNNWGGNQAYGWMNFTSTGQWDDNSPTAILRGIIEIEPTRIALKDSTTVLVNEATGAATVTAVRIGSLNQRVTVEYTTNELGTTGSAQAGADYTTPTLNSRVNTGQIAFEVGESEKNFTIPIVNDTLVEGNESFAVGLQNPSVGTLGAPRTKLITIVDDDSPSTISVSNASLNVAENVGNAVITLSRSGNISGSATVNFSTSNGTAIAGSDYTAVSGTITFAAGQTSQTIAIPIQNDTVLESNETLVLRLSNPAGAALGTVNTATITILDDDLSLGNLTRSTVVSGLSQPTAFDWTPDGRYMLVAQKNGVVRVVDNGTLRSTAVIDLSAQVNNTGDRGLLGLAVHPNFPSTPYLYLSYTYDPPETVGRTGLAGPDGNGNRPSRLIRLTVNPTTMVADPNSLVVLVGKNSTWAYTSRPDADSTGNTSIVPSGIVNGTTITAPADQIDVGAQDNDPDRTGIQNQNIRDYLATDSLSHSIGGVHFGPDGLLYLANGDGTSYNFADPRTVRVQDINNLSGKILRIDPITGQGVASNPFYNGDPNSNQSKVFYSGLRNPYRFGFDPVTTLPVIGDVGWNSWEEINTGTPGSNFGWPYLEGPNRTGGYSSLSQAVSFYNNGNRNSSTDTAAVFPLISRSHGAPDNANAITVGDFYNANTLIFGDVNNGTIYAATLNASRQISTVQVFDSGIPYLVDMEMGTDGRLYAVDLVNGTIVRWNPA